MTGNKKAEPGKAEFGDVDHFWLETVYPNASDAFFHAQKPLDSIKEGCLVVLDANVLLMPYRMGAQSFDEVRRVYDKLSKENRLVIPAQAAREFIKNRANRVRDVARELGRQVSLLQIPMEKSIGFLENEDSFKELRKIAGNIKSLKSDVLRKNQELSDRLRSDVGGDPVSEIYRGVFKDCIVDLDLDEDARKKLVAELRWRFAHSVPPGYKDDDKLDEGIGDLIIWKTILKVGGEQKRDCIFVTEDAKGDWWVQSEGPFQPRTELVDEYRRHSEGGTIHLVPLSDLLALFGAKSEVIDDTKRAEAVPIAVPRPAIQSHPADSGQETSVDSIDQLDLSALLQLNVSLNEKKRAAAVEYTRLKSFASDAKKIEGMTPVDLAQMFQNRDTKWAEFRVLNARQKKVEARIGAILKDLP